MLKKTLGTLAALTTLGLAGCAVVPASPPAYYGPPPVYVAPAPRYYPPPVYVAPPAIYFGGYYGRYHHHHGWRD